MYEIKETTEGTRTVYRVYRVGQAYTLGLAYTLGEAEAFIAYLRTLPACMLRQ